MAGNAIPQSYSQRNGRPLDHSLPFERILEFILFVLRPFAELESEYQAEVFGYACPDADGGWVSGTEAYGFGELLELETGRAIWPPNEHIDEIDSDALYDLIEFTHRHISKPTRTAETYYHANFGHYHWVEFQKEPARAEFRREINRVLRRASPPVELRESGEIHLIADESFSILVDAEPPTGAPKELRDRLTSARDTFTNARTPTDLRIAVRELAVMSRDVVV